MSEHIEPGDRVRVGGRVGDVIRVEVIGSAMQYTIFFEGERPRPILVPPNRVERIRDPLDQASEMVDAFSSASTDTRRPSPDTLCATALQSATDQSRAHGEQESRKRQRDVNIQIEDLERWRSALRKDPRERLVEYRQRLAFGQNMDVLTRREESLPSNVEQT